MGSEVLGRPGALRLVSNLRIFGKIAKTSAGEVQKPENFDHWVWKFGIFRKTVSAGVQKPSKHRLFFGGYRANEGKTPSEQNNGIFGNRCDRYGPSRRLFWRCDR